MVARTVAALVAAAVLAASPSASGAAAPGTDANAVLARFEPVLLFHPGEDWAPTRPDDFVAHARVERQVARGRWAAVSATLPTSTAGCTLTPCYRLNLQPCALGGGDGCYEARRSTQAQWRAPVIYGRLLDVPATTPAPPGFAAPPRYLARYWIFYEFDDWRSLGEHLWQAHEADWESITIGLSAARSPLFAAYSEHCSGTIRAWRSVEKRGSTHPVAYVALGSHANYFTNTSTSTKFGECLRTYLEGSALARAKGAIALAEDRLTDRTGTAHASGPAGLAGTTPLELVELSPPLPSWASFPGRWSEGQLLWLGRVPRRFTSISEGAGPATPNWNATSIPSYWHAASS
jgi:hypothetical protein